MFTVSKEFHFSAMHWLPDHDGQCKNKHGHNYRVEIGFEREFLPREGPKAGMVVDFGDISKWWKVCVEEVVDHNDLGLNGVMPSIYHPTTAEHIARWIYDMAMEYFNKPEPRVTFVRVEETPTAYAEYRPTK